MELFTENGWLDVDAVLDLGLPFNAFVTQRGTGKTYGQLKRFVEKKQFPFIYMRRTQAQLKQLCTEKFNPFKKLNADMGWNIQPKKIRGTDAYGFYDGGGEPLGYGVSLSTFANLRGFDASDVNHITFEEFIPERRERPIMDEAGAFLNAYETMNRNRELEGKPPIQVSFLANSNTLANPLFIELGIVSKAVDMQKKGQQFSLMRERGLTLTILQNSPISEMKKDTALYKLVNRNSSFARMSLGNEFAEDDLSCVASRPLREYVPVVNVGEIAIYKHKSNGKFYVSKHHMEAKYNYNSSLIELRRFSRKFIHIWQSYLLRDVLFEDYTCEVLFSKYFSK